MYRRRYLAGITAVVAFAGCIESPRGRRPPATDTGATNSPAPAGGENDCDGLYSADVPLDPLEPSNERFELALSEATVAVGDDLRIELTNTTDSEQQTGTKSKYAVQAEPGDEWVHGTKYGSPDWSTAAKTHDPGEGFSWRFDATVEGLSTDHWFCGELRPGTYRFVYWGTEPAVAAEFDVTGRNRRERTAPSTERVRDATGAGEFAL